MVRIKLEPNNESDEKLAKNENRLRFTYPRILRRRMLLKKMVLLLSSFVAN